MIDALAVGLDGGSLWSHVAAMGRAGGEGRAWKAGHRYNGAAAVLGPLLGR